MISARISSPAGLSPFITIVSEAGRNLSPAAGASTVKIPRLVFSV